MIDHRSSIHRQRMHPKRHEPILVLALEHHAIGAERDDRIFALADEAAEDGPWAGRPRTRAAEDLTCPRNSNPTGWALSQRTPL